MKIAVVGTGYVGLVSGTCFSDLGNTVTCIDINPEKLRVLNSGRVPFYEPGLEEIIVRNVESKRLRFSEDLLSVLKDAALVFIAVGTPPKEDGSADLSAVFKVADTIVDGYKALGCKDFKAIVTKSTVPVGTGRAIMNRVQQAGLSTETQLAVMSNPEFLREGSAVYDFFHPDRIVLGSDSSAALDLASKLYDPLFRRETPIIKTTLETSELSKYASNAFLATKISFINEMANICEVVGADVKDIAKIMGKDGRIGRYFLHPGPGYGGSCFPKDTQALVKIAEKNGYDLKIVKAVETVNQTQKVRVISKLKAMFGTSLSGKKFAVLGLAFKPNTDDIREAPAIAIIDALLDLGASVSLCDPEALENGKALFKERIEYCENAYEAATDSDAVILVTEWNEYRELDLNHLKSLLKHPYFFDLRNVYDPSVLKDKGFISYNVGRN